MKSDFVDVTCKSPNVLPLQAPKAVNPALPLCNAEFSRSRAPFLMTSLTAFLVRSASGQYLTTQRACWELLFGADVLPIGEGSD